MARDASETEAAEDRRTAGSAGSDLWTIGLFLVFTLLFSAVFWALSIGTRSAYDSGTDVGAGLFGNAGAPSAGLRPCLARPVQIRRALNPDRLRPAHALWRNFGSRRSQRGPV
jgi:hypothetical protein